MLKPAKVVKYVTASLGCVIGLVGAALLVEGLLVRLNSGFFGNEAVTLLNKISYTNIKLGHLLLTLVYGMLASGVVTLFTGVLGIYGAARRTKRSLRVFIALVIVLILVHGTMVGFWVNVRLRSDQWMKGEMLTLLGDYKGPEATDDISAGWNKIFMQARCCGVNDQLTDGSGTSDFDQQQSVWANTNANNEVVPATCCQGTDDDDVIYNINSTCTITPTNYYTKGCFEDLNDLIQFNSLFVFCAAASLLFFKLLAVIGSCFLQDDSINRVSPFFKTRG